LCHGIRRSDGTSVLRRLDHRTKCGKYARCVLTKLRHTRLLIWSVYRQGGEPTYVCFNGALSLIERRAISGQRSATVHRGVRILDGREDALHRGQHFLCVNDPLIGGLRPLDGAVRDPHHRQHCDDGQHSRSAKSA